MADGGQKQESGYLARKSRRRRPSFESYNAPACTWSSGQYMAPEVPVGHDTAVWASLSPLEPSEGGRYLARAAPESQCKIRPLALKTGERR